MRCFLPKDRSFIGGAIEIFELAFEDLGFFTLGRRNSDVVEITDFDCGSTFI